MKDSVKEFVDREIIAERSRFENKDYEYTKEVMQKAGELGFLSVGSTRRIWWNGYVFYFYYACV